MASGLLGKSNPAAATWTNIYTVPSGKLASFTVNAVNQNTNPCNIDIVISSASTSGSIAASEYVEYQASLSSMGSVLERTGLVTSQASAAYVWVRSSNASTAFQVYGYEE